MQSACSAMADPQRRRGAAMPSPVALAALLAACCRPAAASGGRRLTVVAVGFRPYPGYEGPLRVRGGVFVDELRHATLHASYTLFGVDAACRAGSSPDDGGCAVRVHTGARCDDAGAELAPLGSYRVSGALGYAIDGAIEVSGRELLDFAGRTAVVTDASGAPAACTRLAAAWVWEAAWAQVPPPTASADGISNSSGGGGILLP